MSHSDVEHTKPPIVIVGAGPTGLVLALSLARRGIRFRLIDEDDGPGEHSRAMVVQGRTLEFYQQFGFGDEVVDQGVKVETAHLRKASGGGGHEMLTFSLGNIGEGLSPYPFALAYPQDDHERFLISKLQDAGHEVEWNTKLTGFTQTGDQVRATVVLPDGQTDEILVDYLCGCDGANSTVRECLNLGFPGGTYPQSFYVADVKTADGFERDLIFNLGRDIFALLLPVRRSGMQRLIGLVPPELSDAGDISFESIRSQVEPLVGKTVSEVNWFSTYRVHHRVAERFGVGRVFILGDAAHIHSPVGGQGMNTGIGDAINLGWKLAQVTRESAQPSLLDTFETERIGFARNLVATTDRIFNLVVAGGLRGMLVRRALFPLAFFTATRFSLGRRTLFRTISQIRIRYPKSPLSNGKAGRISGGDRLPWLAGEDNFAPLASLGWQLHIYGEAPESLAETCRNLQLPLHLFPYSRLAGDAGLQRNAAYLVRPDGHVALAANEESAASELRDFTQSMGIRFTARL